MPKIALDKIDIRILHYLQSDAKINNADLAEKVGLSPSPCLRRVKKLETDGVIQRYAGIVDPAKVGLPISVFITVRLQEQGRPALEAFESSIADLEEIMECYLMTGTSDYLLRVIVADMESYEQFLLDKIASISSVGNIESSFSLKRVMYRTELPIHLG